MNADMQLVLDTLYERYKSKQGCFVVNQAGLNLLESPSSFVPLIEQVLREVVEPALSKNTTKTSPFPGLDPMWNDVIRQDSVADKFPGISYVLGAYIVLGVKSNPDRAVSFLATLSASLLTEAVNHIPVFFAAEGEGYSPGLLPDQKLKEFVQSLSDAESVDVRTAAARVIDWMSKSESLS